MKKYKSIKPLNSIESLFSLKGKVGLIIGGAGKMGEQFCEVLSKAAATVILADINEQRCERIASRITRKTGYKCFGESVDAGSETSVNKLFENIKKQCKSLDFLIFNVMSKPQDYYAPFNAYPKEAWDKVLNDNLAGAFLCSKKAASLMKKNKGGSIVLTSSIYGVVGPDQRIYDEGNTQKNIYGGKYKLNAPGAYSASKGGLIAYSKYLSSLLGKDGIRVNVLTPGGVYDGQDSKFHEAYLSRTQLNRMAVWSDYNGAVLFLVSPASRYMTGANLVVDGGWTAW